ncbi:MAG: peptidoglycan/LPS O-acetylase OafA/YrhL [Phenylobacterium sp.]|jgi:peptidoglycan/LPS O-acetylase OafA/YrhL
MKFNSLESLRGIAAVLVALFHSGFVVTEKYPLIAQGDIFVDFFFVLSGFVMAFAYIGKIQQGLSIKKFTLLRFGRLYPLHLFILLVWLPYILVKAYAFHKLGMGSSDPFTVNSLPTFLSNLVLINALGIHDSLNWNYPAWSISLEFFTYLIFFTFIASLKSAYRPVYALMLSITAYTLLTVFSEDTLLRTFDIGILRCIGGFFFGVFIYSLSQRRHFVPSVALATVIELLVVAAMLALVVNTKDSKSIQLAAFLSFGVVIYLFSVQEAGLISRLLNTKPLLFVGGLSYSIYMVHAIVFAALGVAWQYVLKMPVETIESTGGPVKVYMTNYADIINVVAMLSIILISYFTYNWIEKPWRDKFRQLANSARFDSKGDEVKS